MSDTELDNDSDHEVSEFHSKLVEAVAQLDKGQRVKKPERSEPTLEVSEFHLVKSGISDKDAVRVQDLAKSLGKKGHHAEITKKLKSARQKTKLLTKPLEKPAADRIKRVVGFETAKKELKKWNAVITKNRVAESLNFPLAPTHMKLEPSNEFVKRFRLQSELEKELAALEPQKENIEEKKDEFSMTLNEIMMRRKEAAKIRALQSYREAKAHRQRKIKSKKFHRVQRKEKIKTQLKEFETLQKTDPEAALEKLEQLDKARAEERMSLRHKSTGQWAKNKQIRAKYDKETRQVLSEQLSIGREITQKIKRDSDSDNDIEESNMPIKLSANDKENPWVGRGKTDAEIDDFIKGYREYWDKKNEELRSKNLSDTTKNEISNEKSNMTQNLSQCHNVLEDKKIELHDVETCKVDTLQKLEDEENERMEGQTEKGECKNNDEQCQNSIDPVRRKKRKVKVGFQSDVITENTALNKREKLQVKRNNPVATSKWNVETIDKDMKNESVKKFNHNNPKSENINELFDSLEDRINNKIECKLQEVKQKLIEPTQKEKRSKTIKRKGRHNDAFDGLALNNKKQRPTTDEPLNETTDQDNSNANSEFAELVNSRNSIPEKAAKSANPEIEIDPNKYINVEPKQLNSELPDIATHGEDALDDSENDEEQHNIISEAFADDDVVEQFKKEKEEEIEKCKPKSIDLTLPGWGSWGGKNIRISQRKKRRFIIKFPEKVERRDENKGDVIIMEQNNPKIKEHLVNELPHPFTSVKDFEASIRMPIGRNFVPENAHRKLIKPVVKTSMGKIIEPMDEDMLVQKSDDSRKNFMKKNVKTAKRKVK